MNWRRWRRVSQWTFFLLFLFLFIRTAYRGTDEIAYPVRIFLHLDPLILLTTFLSTYAVPLALLLSLITAALTLILGRFFCGWVCPLGTLHDAVGHFNRRRRETDSDSGARRVKYYVLIIVVTSSVFTLQIAGFMDPISLLIRSMAVAVEPVLNLMTHTVFDLLYRADIPGVTAASEFTYALLKSHILAFRQPLFYQGVFIGLLFAAILAANLCRRRFWCRYLCPLGALFGVIARVSPVKRMVGDGCSSCGVCERECRTGAASDKDGAWRKPECVMCFECQEDCPTDAVRFGLISSKESPMVAGVDLQRRGLIASIVTGVCAAPLVRSNPLYRRGEGRLIRPPGAMPEDEFLRRCVRCGECMKVCLTNGLQPSLFEAGLEGLWTPRFDFRIGYCQYYCTLCGQVCPTRAINELPKEEKVKVKIGLAYFDKNRCLPYAQGVECIVCEEHCPTPEKAIKFETVEIRTAEGMKKIKRPVVDLELCIGCGICEYKCPLHDQPAIIVTRLGESRGEPLLLPTT